MDKRISFSRLILPLSILVFLSFAIFVERSGISYRITDSPTQFLDPLTEPIDFAANQQIRTVILAYPQGLAAESSLNTVSTVMNSMRIPFKTVDITEVETLELAGVDTLITTFIEFEKTAPFIEELIGWVNNGGKMLLAIRPDNTQVISKIGSQLGIASIGTSYVFSKGVEFLSELLPGSAARVFGLDFLVNSSLPVQLDPLAEVYLVSGDGQGIPLMWKYEFGRGQIVMVNTDQFIGKDSRGIIGAAYTLLHEVVIYPVINSSVFFIDDFPAPLPEGTNEAIFRQFNRDIESFFLNIWFPDMQELRRKFNLRFSSVAIETYTNSTSPPFRYLGGQKDIFQFFGGFVLRNGGEIGLHGYNHIPFCQESDAVNHLLDYPSWESADFMRSSIRELKRFIGSFFPDETLDVYVPVSNILCDDARDWLPEEVPELKVIASVYLPDATMPAYVQEFEEAADGIIEFPRITAGYAPDDYMQWAAANELGLHYVFGHFIHPDDVLDSYRNQGMPWTELRKELDKFLLWIYSSAPGIRNLTASQGAMAVQRFARIIPSYSCKDNECRLTLKNFYDSACFLMRTERQPSIVINGSVIKVADNLYLVEAAAANLVIGFKD